MSPSSGGSPMRQGHGPDLHQPEVQASLRRYWRRNVLIMTVLLAIWAFVGLGCGILFADWLNQFRLPGTGYPLGFWFAQQGSIITFVLLILTYCVLLNRLDRKHHDELERLRRGAPGSQSPGRDARSASAGEGGASLQGGRGR